MSYVVRKRTIGKVEDLSRDLRENLDNPDCYDYFEDGLCDRFLLDTIENWLEAAELINEQEENNETKVADKDREPENTE